jgi:hypothetical protein
MLFASWAMPPLSLTQPLVHLLPVSYVEADTGHVLELAVRIAHHPTMVGQPANPALGEYDAELVIQSPCPVKGAFYRLRHKGAVILVYPGDELLITGNDLLRSHPVQMSQSFIPGQDVTREVPAPGSHAGGPHGQLQPLLALPQRFRCLFSFRDIALDGRDADDPTRRVEDGGDAQGDVDSPAVLPDPLGLFNLHRLSLGDLAQQDTFGLMQRLGDKPENGLPHHLRFGVPEDPFGCSVPTGHDALERLADNRVG